jgi:alkanesulfonate monooxygenase
MRLEFTADLSGLALSGMDPEGRIDKDGLAELARAAEAAGFERLLVPDRDDSQDAASIASYVLNATTTLGVQLEHRAGAFPPEIAARQIATLDQLSNGRVAVRVVPAQGEAGHHLSHEDSLARLDEYIMLLKRLWANDSPIDHEGRFHRLKSAFSGSKPFSGGTVPIALGGASGTAVKVAARHADVFMLPAATVEETRLIIERVRAAAACHGRADAIRFALPMRLSGGFGTGSPGRRPVGHPDDAAVGIAGGPERVAAVLLGYCRAGVTDFVLTGLGTSRVVSAFGREVAPLLRGALASRGASLGEEIPGSPLHVAFARRSRHAA